MSGFFMAAIAIACGAASLVLIVREIHFRSLGVRVSHVVAGEASAPARSRGDMSGWLSSLGSRYRRFYPEEDLENLKALLQSAGLNPYRVTPVWIGVKIISMATAPVVAALIAGFLRRSPTEVLIIALFGLVIGIVGPRAILALLKRRFTKAIKKGSPDAIDLLVVCTEAGMGLEGAVERVAEEMYRTNPSIARVLSNLLDDLRILPNRREAFDKLGASSEGLRRFAAMMSQSLQYGTPLGQALRAIADEMRREMIIKLEERAHQLGAKLIVPMVLFMLPAMFIVLGASPLLHLVHAFDH